MSRPKTRSTVAFLIIRLMIVVLFILASAGLIAYAGGYKFNLNHFSVEATGAISLQGNVRGVTVRQDGVTIGDHLPYIISGLVPGRTYTVSITKPGFIVWQRDITIEPGLVATMDPIRLFPDALVAKDASALDKPAVCANNQPDRDEPVSAHGGEIRIASTLVLRRSTPVTDVCWFNDQFHIAYITGSEVHVVERDGQNDTLIYTAGQNLEQVAVLGNDGEIDVFYSTQWHSLDIGQD